MVGKYDIEVYNNKVHYFLTVKRNITVLQGNSATGKTELIRLIQEHEINGVSSGITLICDAVCTALTSVDWELRLASLSDRIIFIDESANFLRSQRFAEMVRGSDNYFVIVTRDDLEQLPYSIDEIYGLRNVSNAQKYKTYRRVYNEMYRLYHLQTRYEYNEPVNRNDAGKKHTDQKLINADQNLSPELIITEDSNSGFEYFDTLFQGTCISAHGKSNVLDLIRKERQKRTLIIVDGAAFGSEMGKIWRYLESNDTNCIIYAPESFEYLILSAELFDVSTEVLQKTYNYADSDRYISWEEFYTAYLGDITRNTVFQYSKARLADAYRTKGAVSRIAVQLPDSIRSIGKERR